MNKKKYVFAIMLCFSAALLIMTGCGRSKTKRDDRCIVVELPENVRVQDVFNIVSSTELFVSNWKTSDEGTCFTIGKLDNGHSVVWRSKREQLFVYTEEDVGETAILHYINELQEKTPISYEEFKEKYAE